ncbi:digalactosyldiacylglycerol synthase 1, chloroplastic-like isoform X1 [Zingiber officinale]|uniref:digalactosyldiacylglycerol synthase 1, chloroplastic-like isoform X1 n=1 Tax=Zingiber officinale TaxID=94328 RepID=UPI001C4BEB46|nr:digalactosyldiacylglycerol synthase 1, chloroplastic-like isoform X1 [Zingiber officinale]
MRLSLSGTNTTPFALVEKPSVPSSRTMLGRGAESAPSPGAGTAEKALSFISRGWREVRDNADADLRLMRARASSFKSLADRELENFFSFPSAGLAFSSPSELEIIKRIKPKLSELQQAYSARDLSRRVLEKWAPKSTIRIDMSSIRSVIVSEVDEMGEVFGLGGDGAPSQKRVLWKGEAQEEQVKEWDPIRILKMGLKGLERKSQSTSNELVEKVKLSLGSFVKEPQESKEILPLDLPELLAYLVKQSGPLFDHLGIQRDTCNKIIEALCRRHKDHLVSHSLSAKEASLIDENIDYLDLRIASVLGSTGHHYEGGFWTNLLEHKTTDKKRHVAIVTTASLPWMTGTAVNPLFRAAYMAKSAKQDVTLVVPWLCKSDQDLVYPNSLRFISPEEQEAYIRNWLEDRIGFKTDFKISFYPGKFSRERRSIIPAGDTTQFIPSKEADIAILEEPEHLNWYHHGKRWTDKFNYVVGVVHTNYLEYIKRQKNGAIQAFFVKHINNWVTRAYCDKVLRLSAATQELPKSIICNVHGVNPKFLKVGEKIAAEKEQGNQAFSKGAYFLGKMVWAKGYRELIDLFAKHKNDLEGFKLDIYGSGEDSQEVQYAARKLDLNLNFFKGRDHADDSLHGYKVFVNPSVSDVLCTATAEALAMGKFVICADHPSNEFFRAFPNCLTYKTSEDFVARVKEAMNNEPQPLTSEQRYNLSWEAATQRFMQYSELDKVLNNEETLSCKASGPKVNKSISMPILSEAVDGGLAFAHYCFTGNEILRLSTGAIPGTRDYSKQHCMDLHLLPPQVQNPVYGW